MPVDGRFYLAGTYICQQAILAGRIDTYVEYTGTALAAILKQTASGDSQAVYEQVKHEYQQRFNLDVMPPLGFNNSFAMVMRGDEARRLGVTDAVATRAGRAEAAAGSGIRISRAAGWLQGIGQDLRPALREAPRVMDLGLLYRALQNNSVDIVAGQQHRWPDQRARPGGAGRRQALLSALRRGADCASGAVPGMSAGPGSVRAIGRPHYCRRDAGDELRGRWREEGCRRGGAGVSGEGASGVFVRRGNRFCYRGPSTAFGRCSGLTSAPSKNVSGGKVSKQHRGPSTRCARSG